MAKTPGPVHPEPLLTPAEVAHRLKVRPRTVYDMLAPGGALNHLRIQINRKNLRVKASELEAFLAEARTCK